LLLRRTAHTLRAAGHEVALLAPSGVGQVLLGPEGAGALFPWEARELAELLGAETATRNALAARLSSFAAALAYTRSAPVIATLRTLVPRVIVRDPEPGPGTHASRWLAQAVEELGCDPGLEPPVLVATPEEQQAASRLDEQLPERFLAIHPGSGSPRKNWPHARFAALARTLSRERPWLLVEGPADRDAVAALGAASGDAVVARELPARVLGALLARAGLYVGNDSGVSHLAAAFGAPTLALFGPTDPAVWSPVGPRVKALRASDASLAALSVEDVLSAARALAGELSTH
jgi:ADP-heptose:LPS heptosyltransferase